MVPKKCNFTNRLIERLPAHASDSPSSCAEFTDVQTPGLKLQVTKNGHKAWYLRYTIGGKKRAMRLGAFPSLLVEQARQLARDMQGLVDRGIDPQSENDLQKTMPTFEMFALNEYLPYVRQFKRSADDDASKLRLHLIPRFGQRRIGEINTRDLDMYFATLRHTHSAATINRHLALLSKLFKLAVQWERISRNPCLGIKKLKENNTQQRFLSLEEIRRVIAAAAAEPNRYAGAAIQLLLLTGIRREEALQARWEHVDLEQNVLFLPTTKTGKGRYVLLNDAARDLLLSLQRVPDCPWVFPGRDPSKPLNNPRKAFHRILDAAGVGHCRLHDCRHTYASLLAREGASLLQIGQLLGHASPQTTQRYAHLAADTLRDVTQLVARAVGKP